MESSVQSANALPAGRLLHWYEIDSVLGQGGFGITYLARDTNLNHWVAIKEYLPGDLAVRADDSRVLPVTNRHRETFRWGLNRFISEAQTLVKFKHPNIVSVFTVFEAHGTAYMVMEYERGHTLEWAYRTGRVTTEDRFLSIVHPLLDGLGMVHETGFIHRDIKPDNIMLREDGTPVLLDFGSARRTLGADAQTLTTLVSSGYAPFEQYQGNRDGDKQGAWTDIYAMGATLYRGVARATPPDALARVRARVKDQADPLTPAREVGLGRFSSSFLEAIDAALGFDVSSRPESVAKWKAMLGSTCESPRHLETAEVLSSRSTEAIPVLGSPTEGISPASPQTVQATVRMSRMEIAPDQITPDEITQDQITQDQITQDQITQDDGPSQVTRVVSDTQENAPARSVPPESYTLGNGSKRPLRHYLEAGLKYLPEYLPGWMPAAWVPARQGGPVRLSPQVAAVTGTVALALSLALGFTLGDGEESGKTRVQALEVAKSGIAQNVGAAQVKADELVPGADSGASPVPGDLVGSSTVDGLLSAAREDLRALRLTKPAGRNAFERFRAALAMDPKNPTATKGLKEIVSTYISLAHGATRRGDLSKARRYLKSAWSVDPRDVRITLALEEVKRRSLAPALREVAILPFWTLTSTTDGYVSDFSDISNALVSDAGQARLAYSFYTGDASRIDDISDLWTGNAVRKAPQETEVHKALEGVGADVGVMMAIIPRAGVRASVDLFVYDHRTGDLHRRTGTEADVRRLLNDLLGRIGAV